MVKVYPNMERFSQLLAEKNISQNRLAKLAEISSGYMSQVLTGRRNPSAKTRRKMLAAINKAQRIKGLQEYNFDDIFTVGQ